MPLTKHESELRKRARVLIAEGRLPVGQSGRCWGGSGSRKVCSLCGEPVSREEVEFEIEDSSGASYRFHFRCHAAWQLECARSDHPTECG